MYVQLCSQLFALNRPVRLLCGLRSASVWLLSARNFFLSNTFSPFITPFTIITHAHLIVRLLQISLLFLGRAMCSTIASGCRGLGWLVTPIKVSNTCYCLDVRRFHWRLCLIFKQGI